MSDIFMPDYPGNLGQAKPCIAAPITRTRNKNKKVHPARPWTAVATI